MKIKKEDSRTVFEYKRDKMNNVLTSMYRCCYKAICGRTNFLKFFTYSAFLTRIVILRHIIPTIEKTPLNNPFL